MKPGDVFALNARINGGTHLPDVTVVTPVFRRGGNTADPVLRRQRAATTPISAASRPARCRRSPRTRRGRGRADRQLPARRAQGRLREAEMRALLSSGAIRRATRRRTSPT
jgi:hypothetical protein